MANRRSTSYFSSGSVTMQQSIQCNKINRKTGTNVYKNQFVYSGETYLALIRVIQINCKILIFLIRVHFQKRINFYAPFVVVPANATTINLYFCQLNNILKEINVLLLTLLVMATNYCISP